MYHFLQWIIGGLLILAVGLGALAYFSKSKDPTETDEGRVIDFDDPEYRIGEENPPGWKQVKNN